MDAVTYPDERVADFINKNLIALRVQHDAVPHAQDFNVTWTPTIITLDPDGKEHDRSVGFVAPEELVPMLMLGIAKEHFDHERLEESLALLDEVAHQYPDSTSAPEATYLRGVTRFKMGHDPAELRRAYDALSRRYPQSEWTKRAYPYRLLDVAA